MKRAIQLSSKKVKGTDGNRFYEALARAYVYVEHFGRKLGANSEKGFFRNQPKNEANAVEYGSIVVVVGYADTFITTHRTSFCGKHSNGGFFRKAGKKGRRHKVAALEIAASKQEITFAWHQTERDFQDGQPLQ